MREIVAQFRMDRAVLQDRGGLIIRQLCVCLGPNRVFLEMGKTPFLPASMGSFVSVQRALLLGKQELLRRQACNQGESHALVSAMASCIVLSLLSGQHRGHQSQGDASA